MKKHLCNDPHPILHIPQPPLHDPMPEGMEIVPVVYITLEALRLINSSLNDYSGLIVERILNMADFHDLGVIHEVQLDCDWTQQTQEGYFRLCEAVRDQLKPYGIQLSCTIRLWQLACACPPVDRGVLMLYNTESLQNPKVENSIISSKAVAEYMRHARSDKHLDFAYPTYEWTLWFNDGKFKGIVSAGDTAAIKGDLRHEKSDFREIMETKRTLKRELKDIDYPSSTIIYHLDSTNLSKYSNDEITKIYSR